MLSAFPINSAIADSQTVCCDSGPVELFLLGDANSGTLSPFTAALSEESTEFEINDAIAQQREIGNWRLDPAWGGDFPSSTWDFEINYEVKNSGGAQINATVNVEIGSESHTGSTDASNSFLAPGSGKLSISIPVDSGSLSSSSKIKITLQAQTVVFSVPAGDAGLIFKWGSSSDDSSLSANIPLVDLEIEEPTTEGLDVYISTVVKSPWGTMTSAHASQFGIRVNNAELTSDPIETMSGDYVRLTWTWRAPAGGTQNITIEASIQIQSGTPIMSGSTEFTIDPQDDGGGGGGGFYPEDEPLRTNGVGSLLGTKINMELDVVDDKLVLEREIILSIDGEMAYWMRWGMDNIGNDDPTLSQPLQIFKSGTVNEENRRNRQIDEVEKNEFQSQMVNLCVTYMNDGMGIKLNELIGELSELERISFKIDLEGEELVTPHPITMKITTLELVEDGSSNTLLRDFIHAQPTPLWSSINLHIEITTSMTTSLTGADIKGEDSIEMTHRRGLFGEVINIDVKGLDQTDTFTLNALPTTSLLNAPSSLTGLTLTLLIVGFWISLRMTRDKRRSALWIELALAPAVLVALYLAYPPFTVGAISGITVCMWWMTAFASPKRKGIIQQTQITNFPSIECPACSMGNAVTTDERPFRMPCSGCGRVLKIVE
ncbi:MAG: hypothetical protein QGI21_06150 [Candidatus Poseidoniaceae archaeon]|jgi:hypothetical protein|nr:hypothetical protein [Candidatus Poseidoniaceae archaeon]